MELGLHVPDFTWPDGPGALARDLARVATAAEDTGFAKLSVMDHVWQIGPLGPPEHEMLEAYTTLGYLAGHTKRAKLLTLVTGVVYREPGLLAKAVTTLDVLSGGRAMLGIGAAWNEQESKGLGLLFPPTGERFERLEEALRIVHQMWSRADGPFEGKHYRLAETINSPQPIREPHPPIMIGGGGEQKTLRLVAKYADACNLFANPQGGPAAIKAKLDVLKEHCEREGTDYERIRKSILWTAPITPDAAGGDAFADQMAAFAEIGVDEVHVMPYGGEPDVYIAGLGEHVVSRI